MREHPVIMLFINYVKPYPPCIQITDLNPYLSIKVEENKTQSVIHP